MSEEAFVGSPDNPRTAAIVCYLTFVGWLIAYFALYGRPKNSFVAYHLRQTLLLYILTLLVNIIIRFALPADPVAFGLSSAAGVLLFVLWLVGLIHAVNGRQRPIPLIGNWAQQVFAGI